MTETNNLVYFLVSSLHISFYCNIGRNQFSFCRLLEKCLFSFSHINKLFLYSFICVNFMAAVTEITKYFTLIKILL